MENLDLRKAINGDLGYSTAMSLDPTELKLLRDCIRAQWLYRLQLLAPKHIHEFDLTGIDQYHKLAHLVDHAAVWPKTARVFPREVVAALREGPFFKALESQFGVFEMSDEEGFGWENVYWRLVRPGNSDIGPIHSDKWFWDLGHGQMPDYPCERVKIWIAIYTAPGKNGLLVIPGSHLSDHWKWHGEVINGLAKPIFDEKLEDLDIHLVETHPGQAVVFHDKLLHGGAVNMADTCRVSMELTMLVRR
jgi:hypothetical protein